MKLMIEKEEENRLKNSLNSNSKESEIQKGKELRKDNKWRNRLGMMQKKLD